MAKMDLQVVFRFPHILFFALFISILCGEPVTELYAQESPDSNPTPSPEETPPSPDEKKLAISTEGDTKTPENPSTPSEEGSDPRKITATSQLLREISNQVDEHKEETFGTKSRLLLLRASVLRRTIAGSKLVVIHEDKMGSEYELVQVYYALDREKKLRRKAGNGNLDDLKGEIVVDEKIIPGSHILSVQMVYRGATFGGLFSYADGYTFTVQSNYSFTAEESKIHEIVVTAFESGGIFTPLEERPAIGYIISQHEFETVPSTASLKH